MRTIQMTLDDDLVKEIDHVTKLLNTSRSAFTRQALREALSNYNLKQLERKQQEGYKRAPIVADEFSVWESEQDWGDE